MVEEEGHHHVHFSEEVTTFGTFSSHKQRLRVSCSLFLFGDGGRGVNVCGGNKEKKNCQKVILMLEMTAIMITTNR